MQAIPEHRDIDPRYTWNAASVYASDADWDADYAEAMSELGAVTRCEGRLAEGPGVLADALGDREHLMRRIGRLMTYAVMSHGVDTTDQVATRRYGQVVALAAQAEAATSFIEPELLAIGGPILRRWLADEPRLAHLGHYVEDLLRRQAHIRSPEVEELLGSLADPFQNVYMTYSLLANADLRFPPAIDSSGGARPVTQSSLDKILAGADREARRTAWEGYRDAHLAVKNTLAANLMSSVKGDVFIARARRHASSLDMALFAHDIPLQAFDNLIAVFRENLPTWRRYWDVRRRALGVERLHPYDIWAPLGKNPPRIPYEQAVEHICRGLAPLGAEYVEILRRACAEERWLDVYPCRGKTQGAFSAGAPGTHPFILLSYADDAFSLSTMAHELGHSMHSFLTWREQPFVYSQYSMFVAETASNFHQAMVRAHLLETVDSPDFQLAVIEEAMDNFHRYFFIMPTLARFELEVHRREERGQGASADDMIALMADLFEEGYGSGMHVDRQRVGITWATFQHLYTGYYVYQYGTGISAADALARRVRSGTPGAAADYLQFLKAGASLYPIDALRLAGVDMTAPAPIHAAFEELAGLVDRLEVLVAPAGGEVTV